MSVLKYLKNYEKTSETTIIVNLHDYPSCKTNGKKISKEVIYELGFTPTALIEQIGELSFKWGIGEQYYCLNCQETIAFDPETNFILTCKNCNWRNELNDTPAISPIVLLSKTFSDYSQQICYPLIDKDDLKRLTEKQRDAIETYFKNRRELTEKQYYILYRIYEKDIAKISETIRKNQALLKIVVFLKSTNKLK